MHVSIDDAQISARVSAISSLDSNSVLRYTWSGPEDISTFIQFKTLSTVMQTIPKTSPLTLLNSLDIMSFSTVKTVKRYSLRTLSNFCSTKLECPLVLKDPTLSIYFNLFPLKLNLFGYLLSSLPKLSEYSFISLIPAAWIWPIAQFFWTEPRYLSLSRVPSSC